MTYNNPTFSINIEVYEDNSGGLHTAAVDSEDNAIWAMSGYIWADGRGWLRDIFNEMIADPNWYPANDIVRFDSEAAEDLADFRRCADDTDIEFDLIAEFHANTSPYGGVISVEATIYKNRAGSEGRYALGLIDD